MKKAASLSVILSAAFALSACGGNSADNAAPAAASVAPAAAALPASSMKKPSAKC
ncbi:hypothetical protein [Kingella potus]|uniref:hypothetical protein n=1 Tax=Kingella potus TaxID=265175 RepID=UPI001FD05E0B|nr:hypothetical protein [Kingella potus]UOP01448.1 hypothetical protein LVJ84_04380 [Kingella potus]